MVICCDLYVYWQWCWCVWVGLQLLQYVLCLWVLFLLQVLLQLVIYGGGVGYLVCRGFLCGCRGIFQCQCVEYCSQMLLLVVQVCFVFCYDYCLFFVCLFSVLWLVLQMIGRWWLVWCDYLFRLVSILCEGVKKVMLVVVVEKLRMWLCSGVGLLMNMCLSIFLIIYRWCVQLMKQVLYLLWFGLVNGMLLCRILCLLLVFLMVYSVLCDFCVLVGVLFSLMLLCLVWLMIVFCVLVFCVCQVLRLCRYFCIIMQLLLVCFGFLLLIMVVFGSDSFFGLVVLLMKLSRLWLLKQWKLVMLLIVLIVLLKVISRLCLNVMIRFMVCVWMWYSRLFGVDIVVWVVFLILWNGFSLCGGVDFISGCYM